MNPNWAVIGGTVGQEPIAGQEEKEKKMSPIGRLSVVAMGQELTRDRLQAKKKKKKR
jgi:hypothetical protein